MITDLITVMSHRQAMYLNRLVEEDSQNFASRKKLYILWTQKDIRRDGEPLNSTFICGYSIFLS